MKLFTALTALAVLFTAPLVQAGSTPIGIILPNGDIQYNVPYGFDVPQSPIPVTNVVINTMPGSTFEYGMYYPDIVVGQPYNISWNRSSRLIISTKRAILYDFEVNYSGHSNGTSASTTTFRLLEFNLSTHNHVVKRKDIPLFVGTGDVDLTWTDIDSGDLYSSINNPPSIASSYSWLETGITVTYTPL